LANFNKAHNIVSLYIFGVVCTILVYTDKKQEKTMSLPVIVASETKTSEPQEVITFNKWWIEHLMILGDKTGQVTASVSLRKFGTKADQTMVFDDETAFLQIDNVLEEAANDPDLAAVMGGLIAYVGKKTIQEGKASNIIV